MMHLLHLWYRDEKVATITYHPKEDLWDLAYDDAWIASPRSFPLSPALNFSTSQQYASGTIKRFVENLLPEGRALDISATTYGVSKSNVFALIQQLGIETAGAFRFGISESTSSAAAGEQLLREISIKELDDRLSQRDQIPFVVWDKKIRMSIAGYQDKLTVLINPDEREALRMYLASPPLASTHILKPEPSGNRMPYLVANEHYCMKLAQQMGFPVADVTILRVPRPILVVKRFDRELIHTEAGLEVKRLHMIDACQASDLPVSFKYERNLGSNEAVKDIREGMSFEKLFDRIEQTVDKAYSKLNLLRWALFQFLIGNCDAHGKNYSFFVTREGLSPAPWYDLVSVVQYPRISHELAMAFGDVFDLNEVRGFAFADFAKRCRIARTLLQREANRIADEAIKNAKSLTQSTEYTDAEKTFVQGICDFVIQQAGYLKLYTKEAANIGNEFL